MTEIVYSIALSEGEMLRKQRDELLAAASALLEWLDRYDVLFTVMGETDEDGEVTDWPEDTTGAPLLVDLRNAIARAKGQPAPPPAETGPAFIMEHEGKPAGEY
jgi:hypothetical protein